MRGVDPPAIEPLPGTGRLAVPLLQHVGPTLRPCVSVGQRVAAGEAIGTSDEPLPACHAPICGRVIEIGPVATAEAHDVPAVVIEPDPAAGTAPAHAPDDLDHRSQTLAELVSQCDELGLVNLDGGGLPLGAMLGRWLRRGCEHLIVSAMVPEPWLTAGYRWLLDEPREAIARTAWLAARLRARRTWLVVDRRERRLLRVLRRLSLRTPVRLAPLADRYPQSHPSLLVTAIAGRAIPYGRDPADTGVLVLDLLSLRALSRCLTDGVPLISRPVCVAGDAIAAPRTLDVPVGTSIQQVIAACDVTAPIGQVVVGGPMNGRAVDSLDVVVTKRTRAVLLNRSPAVRRPSACVRCGWCQEHCPVNLDPAALLNAAERRDFATAGRLWPFACIECGVCTYVCPSQLPLLEGIRRAKYRCAGRDPLGNGLEAFAVASRPGPGEMGLEKPLGR